MRKTVAECLVTYKKELREFDKWLRSLEPAFYEECCRRGFTRRDFETRIRGMEEGLGLTPEEISKIKNELEINSELQTQIIRFKA